MISRHTVAPALAGLLLALTLQAATGLAAAPAKRKPIDPANMDTSVKPGDDFFHYANGTWLKNNPIPPSESRWGAFSEVQENNYKVLHEILDDASKQTNAPKGSAVQMVGDFYASAMDSARAEADGAKPLDDEMRRIDAMKTNADLLGELAHLQMIGERVPFAMAAIQDAKASTEIAMHFLQGGLGLPDRDYYTKDDDASKKLREQYVAYVTKMFTLLGEDNASATAHAATVLAFETKLANASMTRVQRRDPEASYHKMSLDSLGMLTPAIAWPTMYQAMGIADHRPVIVAQPDFMKQVDAMIASTPIDEWKTYLRWHVVNGSAELLSSAFVNASFDFRGRVLTGATELRPRWKRSLQVVDGSVGEALGQLYVAKTFGPEAKARARKMVDNLRAELRERLMGLEWMSAATKQQAVRKLDAFTVKIGYPDTWRDYSTLTIDRGPTVLNASRTAEFEFKRNIAKLGKPVDRVEWGMTPPTVNAYYNPRMNEIVFPAGILQPPFFDANADDAVNYGGIGAVIGHEMTHGFDDQGRKSDADGNLKDWWTPEDAEKYKARSMMVEKQYDGYVAIDSMHVNGKLTLGENTADLGGLSIAYGALEKALAGKPHTKIDGFTPEQRFFLSFAQIWRSNIRPEALKLRINTDPHSPGIFRCNGPLSNMAEFEQAFSLKDADPMMRAPADRAKIW